MKKSISVSVIVPAYNESGNLENAIKSVQSVLQGKIQTYEIIIVDDGSTDGTPKVARGIIQKNKHVRLVHHSINQGLGRSFLDGIDVAKNEYICEFHGDNDAKPSFIYDFITLAKTADLIFIYPMNRSIRSIPRQLASSAFVSLMNILFGLNLRYYNGTFICKASVIKDIHISSHGLAVYAEAKIRLIKRGYSYKEIPFQHNGRKTGVSKAVSLKSIWETCETIVNLLWDIYILRRP